MLREMTLADALLVCGAMRAADAACVRAASGREPGEWFAVDRWNTHGPAWTLCHDGQPLAIGGLALVNGWTGRLWMVAREGMGRHSWGKTVTATRTVIARALDPENEQRRHRVEAHVLQSWSQASAFAKRLGLRLEGVMQGAGSGGESIEVWAITGPAKGLQ